MKRAALLWLLAACGHSSQPTLYTLSARDGSARADVTGVLELRTPSVAGYLDRHELVLQVASQRLELARDAEWAEPLDAMIARVLVRNLSQRLPQARITLDSGHARAEPQLRVELDVRRFELDAQGQLVLDGLVALRAPTGAPALLPIALARPLASHRADALVQGMSELLGELAERIAQASSDQR
jgi:uncharacterized lipoprotein YmbA